MSGDEKQWEEGQIAWWKDDKARVVAFFMELGIDMSEVYNHVTSVDYERMRVICYLLSKIEKAVKICNFLDTLEKDEYDDVDIPKIYMLISHAEITMNNFGKSGNKNDLVHMFFEPVEDKHRIRYKILVGLPDVGEEGSMTFVDILYKIRCQYAHEGDYTGRIFKKEDDDPHAGSMFRFRSGKKDVFGTCHLTYLEFMKIYTEALLENIKEFSSYPVS